jgi:hypothetical protein
MIFGLNDERASKLSALSQDSAPIVARKSLWASIFHVDDGVDYEPDDQVWVRDMMGEDWQPGVVTGRTALRGKPIVRLFSQDDTWPPRAYNFVTKEPPQIFGLSTVRLSNTVFQGRCKRSYITGHIIFGEEQPIQADTDVGVLDLYLRQKRAIRSKENPDGKQAAFSYNLDNCERDRYLLKPVPLVYRTWMADGMFREACKEDARTTHQEIAIKSLSQKCNDSPDTFFRQSPIKIWALLLFPAQFLNDLGMVVLVLVLFPILIAIGSNCNDHRYFRYERIISLIPRYVVYFFSAQIALAFPTLISNQEYLRLIGIMLFFCLVLYDVAIDMVSFMSFYMDTMYVIKGDLGEGILVCSKKQGMNLTGRDQTHSRIRQLVPTVKEPTLILLLEGLICELQPINPSEWGHARINKQMLRLVSRPVFNHTHPVFNPSGKEIKLVGMGREYALDG